MTPNSMKLSPEAEAEIERLEWELEDCGSFANKKVREALRAAMVWAYRDAANVVEEQFSDYIISAAIEERAKGA